MSKESENKGFASEETNINYKTLKELVIDVINHRNADRQNLEEDFTISYFQTEKEPMFKFDKEMIVYAIMESLDDERFSENDMHECEHIEGLLNEFFDMDFKNLNDRVLKLNYAKNFDATILNKSEILKIINS